MKTPTPFCCDINSGSVEERNEFKRLHQKALNVELSYNLVYYGWDKDGRDKCARFYDSAINIFGNIIPLSEGIAILKEMVGEETKPNGDYVMLPRKLTAENGAKGLLIGEFKESVHFTVDGEENKIDVDVSWTTIKAIYDMVVANLQPKP